MKTKLTRIFVGFIMVTLLLVTVGCEPSKNTVVEPNKSRKVDVKSKEDEYALRVESLQSLREKTLFYTKALNEVVPNSGINNVFYNIKEYYNSNKKQYHYVLGLKEQPLSEQQKELKTVPYNIIKFSVAASKNIEDFQCIKMFI